MCKKTCISIKIVICAESLCKFPVILRLIVIKSLQPLRLMSGEDLSGPTTEKITFFSAPLTLDFPKVPSNEEC